MFLHCPECHFNGKPDMRLPPAILSASSSWTVTLFAEDMAASVFKNAGMFSMDMLTKTPNEKIFALKVHIFLHIFNCLLLTALELARV